MGAEAAQRILMMLYQRISGTTVQQIADEHDGTRSVIYALYDYDAGGDRAAKAIEQELPEYAPGVPISFERLAEQLGRQALRRARRDRPGRADGAGRERDRP